MKISQTFAGNYLKASDIPKPTALQITAVQMVKMPEGDEKPAVVFTTGQQLVLNKTNATILADLWGDETAAWHGQMVELYSTTTSYSGRMVPCIQVRAPQPAVPQPPAPTTPQAAVPQPAQAAPATDYPVDA